MNYTSTTAIAEQVLAGYQDIEVPEFTDQDDYTVTNEGGGSGGNAYC